MRPSRAEVAAAGGRRVPDVIRPGLLVLFCGINPGLYSAAVGHHFARPGNRFWKVLQLAGFMPRLLAPEQDGELPDHGLGVTNLVDRATAGAAELSPGELRAGAAALAAKVEVARPAWVAFLGIGAYRVGFAAPAAGMGPQSDRLADARVWVLPNPSGRAAHYQLPDLVAAFAALRRAALPPSAGPATAGPGSRPVGPA